MLPYIMQVLKNLISKDFYLLSFPSLSFFLLVSNLWPHFLASKWSHVQKHLSTLRYFLLNFSFGAQLIRKGQLEIVMKTEWKEDYKIQIQEG